MRDGTLGARPRDSAPGGRAASRSGGRRFVGLVCLIGMQLHRGLRPDQVALTIGHRLGLHDPRRARRRAHARKGPARGSRAESVGAGRGRAVNERVRELARCSGACGAWKSEGVRPARFDRKVRKGEREGERGERGMAGMGGREREREREGKKEREREKEREKGRE